MTGPTHEVDTSIPHEARVYDYWLGGKDNYAADRALGDAIRAQVPTISMMARANRAVMRRMVHHLATEHGVRQFLDIGTGIPTPPNAHQVAQSVDPAARVLYADIDPLVLAHARALMQGTPEGRTSFVLADFRRPETILESPEFRATLDLGEPVALMLIAILMYFDPEGEHDPYPTVKAIVDALPSGSFLAITHPASDFNVEAAAGAAAAAAAAGVTLLPRPKEKVAQFFDGMELIEPGIVPVPAWHPSPDDDKIAPEDVYYWAGVARKA